MYLTFGKDLSPEYPTVESVIKRLARSGIIRKTRLDNLYKIARVWAARDKWDYYRELVKERAMVSCRSSSITFQAACSAEVGKVMRTLEFSSKFLDQTVLLDLVRDRSTILAKLIMDAIVVEDISMKVFKKLAQKSILCSTLDAKEKLYMSASEAHQFLTSAQKTLLQFMAPQIRVAAEGDKIAEEGSGSGSTQSNLSNTPTVTTEAAKLLVEYWLKEKSAADKGVSKFGNRIQEAPKDSDFTKFSGSTSEDAVIVGEEGSDKSSKR
jgi:predicted transcriptional regulator